jgi:hypothetical protein
VEHSLFSENTAPGLQVIREKSSVNENFHSTLFFTAERAPIQSFLLTGQAKGRKVYPKAFFLANLGVLRSEISFL